LNFYWLFNNFWDKLKLDWNFVDVNLLGCIFDFLVFCLQVTQLLDKFLNFAVEIVVLLICLFPNLNLNWNLINNPFFFKNFNRHLKYLINFHRHLIESMHCFKLIYHIHQHWHLKNMIKLYWNLHNVVQLDWDLVDVVVLIK